MAGIVYENWTVPVFAFKRNELTDYVHVHRCVEIVTVLEGGAKLRLGHKEYDLTEGQTVFIFPNMVHSFDVGADGITCYYATVGWGILSLFGDIFTSYFPGTPVIEKTSENLKEIFKELASLVYYDPPFKEQTQSAYAELLIAGLLPYLDLKKLTDVSGDNVERMLIYCNENFAKKITVEQMGADLHISPTYIQKVFRRYLGTTLTKYITALRIMEAERVLLDEKRSITDAAMSAGFQSIRTFNRIFITEKGMTPGDYRKKLLETLKRKDK